MYHYVLGYWYLNNTDWCLCNQTNIIAHQHATINWTRISGESRNVRLHRILFYPLETRDFPWYVFKQNYSKDIHCVFIKSHNERRFYWTKCISWHMLDLWNSCAAEKKLIEIPVRWNRTYTAHSNTYNTRIYKLFLELKSLNIWN